MRYWSADTLFWKVSIDHKMDVQYQRCQLRLHVLLAGVWPPCYVASSSPSLFSNTASHVYYEKSDSRVSMSIGLCLVALLTAEALLLDNELEISIA